MPDLLKRFYFARIFCLKMIYPTSIEDKIGFKAVRDGIKTHCVSSMGRELADSISFMTDFDTLDFKLRSTAEMLAIISAQDDMPISSLSDIREQLRVMAIAGAALSTTDLVVLRGSLSVMSAVVNYFQSKNSEEESPYPLLVSIISDMETFDGCVRDIDRVIDRYGNILNSASPELGRIRRELNSMNGRVNSVMRNVIARAQREGILDSDTTPTMRDGRLMLPVAPMNKRSLGGIVHDESASGKTVFIEPAEVVEANNKIRELELEERRETARILGALTDALRPFSPDMGESNKIMGEMDFIHAKAAYAKETGACMPHFSREPQLELYHACHPELLVSLARQGKEIVPLDIELNRKNRILIISGPNAGGKSVCLKTVAVIQYMIQCGVLPPVYENSHIGIFDDIFIDIGDDQSIENDLSTYSSHLRNMSVVIRRGRQFSMVLIDEFGGGTEPQIGGAIAQAILRQINEKGMWGVITTHYQNLKHFAEDTEGLINGSMLYDRQKMEPLFKLAIGNPGSSFAIEIALKTGLPKEIIEEAKSIVGSDYVNMDKYLLDIARDKKYWENKRQSIRQKEKKIDQVLDRYETEADELRASRKLIISEAKAEASRIIDESNASIERVIHEIRKSQAEKEKTREARQKLKDEREDIGHKSEKEPEILRKVPRRNKNKPKVRQSPETKEVIEVGDIVKLNGEGTPGKVISIEGKQAQVVFGMIKTTVDVSKLRHTMSKLPSGNSQGASFISSSTSEDIRSRQLQFNQDIDVRGMRVDEALQAVTYFIDDAIQFSASKVRILHGTGTGALRQSIREYLATVKGVRNYHDENVQFGGAGITVVELE